jgi:hypothetical protein
MTAVRSKQGAVHQIPKIAETLLLTLDKACYKRFKTLSVYLPTTNYNYTFSKYK